jgi:hypothetical protein
VAVSHLDDNAIELSGHPIEEQPKAVDVDDGEDFIDPDFNGNAQTRLTRARPYESRSANGVEPAGYGIVEPSTHSPPPGQGMTKLVQKGCQGRQRLIRVARLIRPSGLEEIPSIVDGRAI